MSVSPASASPASTAGTSLRGRLLRSPPFRAFVFRALVLLVLLLAAGVLLGGQMIDAGLFALGQLLFISPWIVAGLLVTGAIVASGAMTRIAAIFEGQPFRMIGLVSLIGAITPVCGITVLPLIAALLGAGVSLAPIMAFLLSSPITSPEMFAITAATLGVPFAVGKSVAAFAIGLFGGAVTLLAVRAGGFADPVKDSGLLRRMIGSSCECGPQTVNWRFWQEPDRRTAFTRSLIATGKLVLLWLSLAFLAEYFLRLYLPPDMLARYVGSDSPWAVPLAATIGAPIYLDGYAALPLIRALIEKGMADGAAMAFLISGGIISAWAALPVFALVRLPVFTLYVVLAVVASMLSGWAYGLAVS